MAARDSDETFGQDFVSAMVKRVVLTRDDKAAIFAGQALKFDPVTTTLSPKGDALTNLLCSKQEWKCFWCGEAMSNDPTSPLFRTKDHIVPLSTGAHGVRKSANIRAVCRNCNAIRGEFSTWLVAQKNVQRLEEHLRQCQTALRRHKITMSGRCYWCKAKYHVREWWHKLKAI